MSARVGRASSSTVLSSSPKTPLKLEWAGGTLAQPNPSASSPPTPVAFPQKGSSETFQEVNRGCPGAPLHARGLWDSSFSLLAQVRGAREACILVPVGQDQNHSPSVETPAPNTATCPPRPAALLGRVMSPPLSVYWGEEGQNVESLRNNPHPSSQSEKLSQVPPLDFSL